MNVEFNGIISGFEIFALHIRIFRVKKVAPTDGPTQAVKETCTGDPRLPYLIESLWGLDTRHYKRKIKLAQALIGENDREPIAKIWFPLNSVQTLAT